MLVELVVHRVGDGAAHVVEVAVDAVGGRCGQGFRVAVVPRGRTLPGERGIPSRRTIDGLTVIEVDDIVGALLTLDLTPPL